MVSKVFSKSRMLDIINSTNIFTQHYHELENSKMNRIWSCLSQALHIHRYRHRYIDIGIDTDTDIDDIDTCVVLPFFH